MQVLVKNTELAFFLSGAKAEGCAIADTVGKANAVFCFVIRKDELSVSSPKSHCSGGRLLANRKFEVDNIFGVRLEVHTDTTFNGDAIDFKRALSKL
ncbi:hypothetical protein CIG21_12440 [Corynebacterium hadale]|uniref:Uncharacterized protein n=1 Tax=Corynebacterium hadale TaxID=2026255 RepID=A0A269P9Q3_9CORY|nr:hypothetical protein CIG21_12440 [Corynebacterium hadale]